VKLTIVFCEVDYWDALSEISDENSEGDSAARMKMNVRNAGA
jgi:hypothetical protein